MAGKKPKDLVRDALFVPSVKTFVIDPKPLAPTVPMTRSMGLAVAAITSERSKLANALWDLQSIAEILSSGFNVDRLSDIARLLDTADARFLEARGALARLEVRRDQLQRMIAVKQAQLARLNEGKK